MRLAARREQNFLKLNYVVHEVRTGANATILSAAGTGAGNLSRTGWGTVMMSDNVVRESESTSSTLIATSTGFGAVTSSLGIRGGIMSITKVTFNDASKWNASSLTFSGTFATPNPPYEAIVMGGTGLFRGCRGYAIASPGLTSPPVYTTKWEVFLWK